MSDTSSTPQAVIWTDKQRIELVRRVLDGLGESVSAVAIGGPRRGEVAELADSRSTPSRDDFRQMLVDYPQADLFLATASSLKREDIDMALAQGARLFALEPLSGIAEEPRPVNGVAPGGGRIIPLPRLGYCPSFLAAVEPQQAVGPVEAVSITSSGPAADMSLFARLADAIDFVVQLAGVPDQIDAALVGGLVEPPDNLRGLTGHMTVNLHFADRAAASVLVSDRSTVHRRDALIIGHSGMLWMDDQRYALYAHADADAPDRPQPLDAGGPDAGAAPLDVAQLIVEQWRWHLAHTAPPDAVDRRDVIGCCETALLSTRTGQSESTDRILRLT